MRDPARIDRVLAALRAAWLAAPDLRLGQRLMTVVPVELLPPYSGALADRDAAFASWSQLVFYLEDDLWEAALLAEAARTPDVPPEGRAPTSIDGRDGGPSHPR